MKTSGVQGSGNFGLKLFKNHRFEHEKFFFFLKKVHEKNSIIRTLKMAKMEKIKTRSSMKKSRLKSPFLYLYLLLISCCNVRDSPASFFLDAFLMIVS